MSNTGYERPPSSRQPKGMRPPSNRNKNGPEFPAPSKGIPVINRPTTKQGLPSARTQSGSRQVADKTFYIGLLRRKLNDTMAELKRLQEENEQKKRNQSIQSSLEQEVNTLRNEIAQSEAELADYNVLSDRLKSKFSQDEMIQNLNEYINTNNQLERDVDKLFREKKDSENMVLGLEKQVQDMRNSSQSSSLKDTIKEIEQLESQLKEIKGDDDDLKGKSKEQLNQIMKDYTQKKGDIEKQIQEQQKSLQYIQQQIKGLEDLESELQTQKGKQYLSLLNREKEINQFNQNFHHSLDVVKRDILKVQKEVIEILNLTSRDLESIEKLPSLDNYNQLKQDLAYKQRIMTEAQSTDAQLKNELEQRRRELESLQDIDKKIILEEEKIDKEIREMLIEMPHFEEVDQVRQEGELKKKKKTLEKENLTIQREFIKKQVEILIEKYNKEKSLLNQNENYNRLHEFEKEIRNKALEMFLISETIEDDRRKTNYAMVKRHCLSIVNQINEKL